MISFRRKLLDKLLFKHSHLMRGKVIDIGGKKLKKRGKFLPPQQNIERWEYLNIDESTNPDYCCSAENIPVENSFFDTIIFCEILEHLEKPEKVLKEISRIIKPDGVLIASIPFLFPVHADPYDFQRWTKDKINKELLSLRFSEIEITPMGGPATVFHDIIIICIKRTNSIYLRLLLKVLLISITPFLNLMDNKSKILKKSITTGHFIIARK